jgi:hypothetical protein
MRHAKWVALLAVLSLVPGAQAQALKKAERTERRIARLMDRLRDQMWAYRQELDFFQRAPEYAELVELRYQLRGQAIHVAELEEGGPRAQIAQRELAREMEQTARELARLTSRMENRTDIAAREVVRDRADRLKHHADEIRNLIARLHDVVR